MTLRTASVWFCGTDDAGWDAAYDKQSELRESGDYSVVSIVSEQKTRTVAFNVAYFDDKKSEYGSFHAPSQIKLIIGLRDRPNVRSFNVERDDTQETLVYVVYF